VPQRGRSLAGGNQPAADLEGDGLHHDERLGYTTREAYPMPEGQIIPSGI